MFNSNESIKKVLEDLKTVTSAFYALNGDKAGDAAREKIHAAKDLIASLLTEVGNNGKNKRHGVTKLKLMRGRIEELQSEVNEKKMSIDSLSAELGKYRRKEKRELNR